MSTAWHAILASRGRSGRKRKSIKPKKKMHTTNTVNSSKKPRDPNAPKKYLSSYFIYCQEHKDKITGSGNRISQWRSMTERKKKEYQKKSKKQKQAYLITLEQYKKTDKYHEYQHKLKEWKQNKKDLAHHSLNKSKSNKNNKKGIKPLQRTKLEKPLTEMSIDDLKKEIKKREKNQEISNLTKSELKSILFDQIKLSPKEIDKLTKREIRNELEMFNSDKGSDWIKSDLADYLKYIYSNPNIVDDINGYINNDIAQIKNKEEITKDEFIKIPLFKLQKIYTFYGNDRNRNKMWEELELNKQQKIEWNQMIEKHLLLKESIKNKQNNDDFCICGEWKIDEDFGYGDKHKYYLYINKSRNKYYGSFLIGPIEGKLLLKSNGMNKYLFDWRGREIGENVIIRGNKVGEIKFSQFGTEANGILQSDYGEFNFHAFRVSSDVEIDASQSDFENDEEEQYERERVNRWK